MERSIADEPYELPVLLSLTGPFAFLGKEEAETFRGVESVVNRTGGIRGRPLHFAVSDIQSSPTVAVQVATQILAKHPSIIMGPEPGAAVNAVTPLVKNDAVLYALSGAAKPAAGSFVFSASVGTRDQMIAGMRFLRARGVKRLGVIATTDATGADQIAMVEEGMRLPENSGMSLAATEHFAIADLNVTPQLTRIRAASADALWIGTTGSGFGTVLRSFTEAGMSMPLMTNGGNVIRIQMDQYSGFMPKEMYFTGPLRFMARSVERNGPVKKAQGVFYDSLRELGIAKPDVGHNLAWDAAWVVVSALRKLGPSATAEEVHTYISTLHGFPVTNGIMDFRDGSQRGVGLDSTLIVRWDIAKDDWLPVSEAGGLPLRTR
jgi:branched-chain amino acid transport system substrate-binding protein